MRILKLSPEMQKQLKGWHITSAPRPRPPWIILHVPHASTHVPEEYRSDFLLSYEELQKEHRRLVDHRTDELFDLAVPHASKLVAPVSRLLVDVERFEDDAREPMVTRGMGVLYERTIDGSPLRTIPQGRREELLERYYRPHHEALTRACDTALRSRGRALIIDCHSYPRETLDCEIHPGTARPDICLGTAGRHTPDFLVDVAASACVRAGLSVGQDSPFPGSIVPLRHLDRTPDVMSLMIEVRRDLYLEDSAAWPPARGPRFQEVRGFLTGLVTELARAAQHSGIRVEAAAGGVESGAGASAPGEEARP